jgi:putative transposase
MGNALQQQDVVNRVWQPGFFDHLLRSSESYSEKWEYVRLNPVRKGLVDRPEEWPYQGQIIPLRL